MSKNDHESGEPSVEPLPHDSILTTIESIQRQLYLLLSIADILSSVSPSSTLDPLTLPSIGSFLSDELTQALTALDSLHKAISPLNSTTDTENHHDSAD